MDVFRNIEMEHEIEIMNDENLKRKGKALLYWMTSTSTSTLFSYTATTTLGLIFLALYHLNSNELPRYGGMHTFRIYNLCLWKIRI